MKVMVEESVYIVDDERPARAFDGFDELNTATLPRYRCNSEYLRRRDRDEDLSDVVFRGTYFNDNWQEAAFKAQPLKGFSCVVGADRLVPLIS